jgi:hypothetical protein
MNSSRLLPIAAIALGSLLACGARVHADSSSARAKYAPHVTRLFRDSSYFRHHDAPDFWKLISYYVPQRDDGACAPSTLVMVLNAMRADQNLKASDKLVTQNDLFSKMDVFKIGKDAGIIGVSLDGFGRLLTEAMKKYGIDGWSFELYRPENRADVARAKLHQLLVDNEKSSGDFVVGLFFQADLTGDPEGAVGHFAPIGAFDGERVLVLDPDREWYEPYWVPERVFFDGISNSKIDNGKGGGYVRIWRKSG